jgi:hypothetical protein
MVLLFPLDFGFIPTLPPNISSNHECVRECSKRKLPRRNLLKAPIEHEGEIHNKTVPKSPKPYPLYLSHQVFLQLFSVRREFANTYYRKLEEIRSHAQS